MPLAVVLVLVIGGFSLSPSSGAATALQTWTISGSSFMDGTFQNTTIAGGTLQLLPRTPINRSVVIPTGPGGSADSVAAYFPSVLREANGTYKMWYTGSNGASLSILLALSLDGFRWVTQGMVLSGSNGAESPCVLRIGSVYHMWFTLVTYGGSPLGYLDQIYHATSADGVSWSVQGLALGVGAAGSWDGDTVAEPWVVRDTNGLYRMFFEGLNNTGNSQIGEATSSDLVTWTPSGGNPIVRWGAPGAWDSGDAHSPSVLVGPTWTLYYGGRQNSTRDQIGIAWSTDGYNWTKSSLNPAITPEPAPAWDDWIVGSPGVFQDPAGLRVYYSGTNGNGNAIGVYLYGPPPAMRYLGSYVSPVFDTGGNGTLWAALTADSSVPAGTSLSLRARVGNDSPPDGTWSSWASSASLSQLPRTRYAQVAADFVSTAWNLTASVSSISLAFEPNAPPLVAAWSPSASEWIANERPTVKWNMTDPEGDAIISERVQISLASTFALISEDSGNLSAGVTSWQVPYGLADGIWFWRVQAEDSYGAWSTWSTSELRIDTAPPQLTVTSPTPGALFHTNTVDILWLTTDLLSGVDRIDVSLDGAAASSVGGGNSSMVLSGVADGTHLLRVTSVDRAGNAATVTLSFTVDTGIFSPAGPYGVAPLAVLVSAVGVTLAIVAFAWLRRRGRPPRPEPKA